MVLNRMISGETPPLVDEMASHSNMQIETVVPNGRKIISPINALKRIKTAGSDGLSAELFIAALAVCVDRPFALIRNTGKPKPFIGIVRRG